MTLARATYAILITSAFLGCAVASEEAGSEDITESGAAARAGGGGGGGGCKKNCDGGTDSGSDAGTDSGSGGGGDPQQASAIGAMFSRACAVVAQGKVFCWGSTSGTHPVEVPNLVGAASVAPGGSHTCAAMADGTVKCWGDNAYGQLGDGTTTAAASPQTVPGLSGVVQIVADSVASAARRADGSVYTWGWWWANGWVTVEPDLHRSLTPEVQPVYAPSSHIKFVNHDGYAGYSARPNSIRQYWNPDIFDTPLPGVSKVEIAGTHSCALATGGVYCWGSGPGLGDGTTGSRSTPQAVPGLGAATDVVSGGSHTCAIVGGQVYCWGYNTFGQLGNGSTTISSVPTLVSGLSDIVALAAANHTCAVRQDGAVFCWGNNSQGQLGDGTTTNRSSPVAVVW